jgi:hypothetical protein
MLRFFSTIAGGDNCTIIFIENDVTTLNGEDATQRVPTLAMVGNVAYHPHPGGGKCYVKVPTLGGASLKRG